MEFETPTRRTYKIPFITPRNLVLKPRVSDAHEELDEGALNRIDVSRFCEFFRATFREGTWPDSARLSS